MTHDIRFMRVIGVSPYEPSVLAFVDEERVTWNHKRGWRCVCGDQNPDKWCVHIVEVRRLVDPRIVDFD